MICFILLCCISYIPYRTALYYAWSPALLLGSESGGSEVHCARSLRQVAHGQPGTRARDAAFPTRAARFQIVLSLALPRFAICMRCAFAVAAG